MAEVVAVEDDGDWEPQTVAEKRRAQIVAAAIRLFSERGYFQTTIEDVANAVPISKGLVYRYFKDKNDLLFFVLRHVIEKYNFEEIQGLLPKGNALDVLIKVLGMHCRLATEHTQEVTLAYCSTKDLLPEQRRQIKILESKIARVIRQCLEACIHGGMMSELNTDIMAFQYIMFGHSWALKNWAFRDRYSPDEYMAEGEKILIRPFLTDLGRREFEKIHDGAA
ncbi:putative TetR-family transcriptional regulator [Magnetospirillum sp. XM-1]|uniref:TetR/AcrR family transcriptional regulator n=1 Tax=Magnetospirillum sp. XM-1 TaxID=1663591 RepID=UPI00073DDDF7|nr:TetR/AcrR family transcriptional regulator [Magnetospirillum sp. XM-1]CUW39362.1 putative TetR-family transcriptional regulator [Magnetospirillum sp. XM-1]